MLLNLAEYQKMFAAETQLWWYRVLHEKIVSILEKSQKGKAIKILDAGCGTGGLLLFLQQNRYHNLQGFDYSEAAVAFCKNRNLPVIKADICNLNADFTETFDVIICNDVLYQFDNEQITSILKNLSNHLSPSGIFISNNQAFKIFSGIHDLAVGAKQRFTLAQFVAIFEKTGTNFKITNHYYWSFFLSPLILLARIFQQLKLKLGLVEMNKIKSDVEIPPPFINHFLYKIVKIEEKLLTSPPFGSSILFVAQSK